MTRKPAEPQPPDHLAKATAVWWASVVAEYQLEPHHVKLLTLAAEAFDRSQEARRALATNGLTYDDKGRPRARPEVAIERDSRLAFARLVREIGLQVEDPNDSRPPRIGGGK